jgi:hypothetical protein
MRVFYRWLAGIGRLVLSAFLGVWLLWGWKPPDLEVVVHHPRWLRLYAALSTVLPGSILFWVYAVVNTVLPAFLLWLLWSRTLDRLGLPRAFGARIRDLASVQAARVGSHPVWLAAWEGAIWGGCVFGILRARFYLSFLPLGALIFYLLIPVAWLTREWRGKIAIWALITYYATAHQSCHGGFSFDVVRTCRFFAFDLGMAFGSWLGVAVFAVLGACGGMATGTALGYLRLARSSNAPAAQLEGRPFLWGLAVPLGLSVTAVYGYFRFLLPFAHEHLPVIGP